ncbi:MAG: molecular chaperone SurA [Gammaproteobacteria bacterium BRH_c0]|nr:MAG: molecular chaperone SurA [Gammaproteobacteria bacterium BRH_c0]
MFATLIKHARNLLPVLPLALCASAALGQVQLLDSIAAIVDNDVVMTSELNDRVKAIYQRIEESGTEPPPTEVLVPQVLDRLILERIQLEMARRASVRISDEELNSAITSIAAGQNMTTEQFLSDIEKEGLSIADLKEQLRTEMLVTRVQQAQVNRRIFISEQEIENFLASEEGRTWTSPDVNLGNILIPLSSAASREEVEAANEKAAMLIERLAQGEDFRSLAIAHSGDQSALQGGDLGWRKIAQLPEVLIPAVSELEPGQVTQPVRSNAGLHILKLYDKRGGDLQMIQQSKVRHILLKPNEIRNDEDTYTEIAAIADSIRSGKETFADMAKAHSEDLGSALNGGDVGWSLPGKFVPEFDQVLNNVALNTVSEPFRTTFGWHILEVTERRDQDFSEEIKRSQAENILRQRKFDSELQIWLQEIRDEAFVDIKS